MIRGRLKLLDGDEVMFVRLDSSGENQPTALAPDTVLTVKEVLGDGHVVVARILARPRAGEEVNEPASGGTRPIVVGRKSGRHRNIRRRPEVADIAYGYDEDDDERQGGLP